MAGLGKLSGRGQEKEAEQREQQERDAHKRNVEAAYRMIDIFNQNTDIFRKNGVVFCLDREKPPFAPSICLFRRNKPRRPEMLFVPVAVGSPYGTFSFRALIKKTKREPSAWMTNHIKYYEEHHTRLSDDPDEAAAEVIKGLTNSTLEFHSLWGFDRTMGVCARRYFARRRAALGLGLVAVIAVAAMCLLWIAQLGW
jgi:hypothetical protein